MRRTPDGQKIYGLEELVKIARADNAELRYITYLGDQSLELIRTSLPADCSISTPREDGSCKINNGKVMLHEELFYTQTVVIDIVNSVAVIVAGEQLIYIAGEKKDDIEENEKRGKEKALKRIDKAKEEAHIALLKKYEELSEELKAKTKTLEDMEFMISEYYN